MVGRSVFYLLFPTIIGSLFLSLSLSPSLQMISTVNSIEGKREGTVPHESFFLLSSFSVEYFCCRRAAHCCVYTFAAAVVVAVPFSILSLSILGIPFSYSSIDALFSSSSQLNEVPLLLECSTSNCSGTHTRDRAPDSSNSALRPSLFHFTLHWQLPPICCCCR